MRASLLSAHKPIRTNSNTTHAEQLSPRHSDHQQSTAFRTHTNSSFPLLVSWCFVPQRTPQIALLPYTTSTPLLHHAKIAFVWTLSARSEAATEFLTPHQHAAACVNHTTSERVCVCILAMKIPTTTGHLLQRHAGMSVVSDFLL